MAMTSFAQFGEMHRSVLQEICNMGAGNAATSISEMISTPTDISTPQVKILAAAEAGKIADMLSMGTEAYLIKLCGDLTGSLLFLFPYPYIERTANVFFPGTVIKGKADISEMSASVINETVNIAAAAYANNFALMTNMTVDISVPNNMKNPSKEILAVNTIDPVNACFVNTSIEITDCHKAFNVLFFPELGTIQTLMGKLGVEC